MILGIGIDLVEIDRFNQDNASRAFLSKVFTQQEIEECQAGKTAAIKFAVKFALKEAFMKAISAGIGQEVWFTNIEIINEVLDQPRIIPQKKAKQYFDQLKASNILISYSTTRRFVIGVVVITK